MNTFSSAGKRHPAHKPRMMIGRGSVVVLVGALAVLLGHAGELQAAAPTYAYSAGGKLVIDHTDSGDPFFCYERPTNSVVFGWGGRKYLLVNASVDALIFSTETPGKRLSTGHFGLGLNCPASQWPEAGTTTAGTTTADGALSPTSDIASTSDGTATAQTTTSVLSVDQVTGTGVCHECRYGFITSSYGSFLFDLGAPSSAATPGFRQAWWYSGDTISLTYQDGGSQYLVAQGLSPICSSDPRNPGWGLYRIIPSTVSGQAPTFVQEQCMDSSFVAPDWGTELSNGSMQGGATNPNVVVYHEEGNGDIVVAKVASGMLDEVGRLSYTGNFSVSDEGYPSSPAYLLTTNANRRPSAQLYSISAADSTVTLSAPLIDFPEPTDGTGAGWAVPALTVTSTRKYALLLTPSPYTSKDLFKLEDLGTITPKATESPADATYWNDIESDFNTVTANDRITYDGGATFAPGGSGVYLDRYFAMVYLGYNGASQVPTAALHVQQTGSFPGDTISVVNDSYSFQTTRLWITRGPALTDEVVADTGWNATAVPLTWSTDPALDCTKPYYAHVQIDDTGASNSAPVDLNCTPAASIGLSPPAPLAGETVTLTASGQGSPPQNDDSKYVWTITPKGGVATTKTGPTTQVQLTPGGDWEIKLDLTYLHWNALDPDTQDPVLYTATATQNLTVSVTAPKLAVSPTTLGPDADITLSAAGTRVQPGLAVGYVYTVDGQPVPVAGCSGTVTGQPDGSAPIPDCVTAASAVIPVDAQLPYQATAGLALTAAGVAPSSAEPVSFKVVDTSVDFTWSPDNPEKGQTVTFTINGDTSGLAESWDFGGANCDGSTKPDYCAPYCYLGSTWSYRDAGDHVVTLNLSDGSTVTNTINVKDSGGCTSQCTYTLTGNHSYPATATTGTVNVTTASGCSWTAKSNTSWITNVSPTSGSSAWAVTFSISANPLTTSRSGSLTIAGQNFSQTFSVTQAAPTSNTGSVDFTWSPTSPAKGESVTFAISGDTSGMAESWDFGGANCEGSTEPDNCAPYCYIGTSWSYRDAGTHTVTLHLSDGSTVPHTINVQDSGGCATASCTYVLSATAQEASAESDSGQVTVRCGTGCAWAATSSVPWLSVAYPASGTGTGTGILRWSATANPDQSQRVGSITVAGGDTSETLTVTQAPATAPAPPESLIVPAAAQIEGENHTSWRSDLRLFNPSDQAITATLEFLPSYGDNNTYPSQGFEVPKHGTLWIENVNQLFPDEVTGQVPKQGAVVITYSGDVVPSVVSRTYTDDPSGATQGTYGQQIPAAADTNLGHLGDVLYLPGVEHDASYRTNIGLVNPSDGVVNFKVSYHSLDGETNYSKTIPLAAKRYVQMTLPAAVGVTDTSMNLKGSVEVELTGGTNATAWASVVDQNSGDPIFIQPVKN